MFEDISTGKRYLAGAIHTSMYDHTKKKPKKIVGGVIGIGMWNVDTRKFEMFYDEELMTASNLDECRRRVENYGNLRGRPIGLDRIYNIRGLIH